MSKQGISTGSAPNDGTGDTLLAGTIKINDNFNEIYDIFGDGTNLVSFVSFATTAGYSTAAGIASTSTSAGIAASVSNNIDINTSGVVTTSYADVGKITIQQPGAITDGPIEVGFAATMFRIKADGMVGIGTSLPTSQLEVASFSNERPTIWAVAKGNGHGLRVSDQDVTDAKSFVVTKDAYTGIGSTAPTCKLDVQGDVLVSGASTLMDQVNFNSDITEKVVGNFSDSMSVSAGGTFTVDVSLGSVVCGVATTAISSWAFTNVSSENSKATTSTLIINAGLGYTYGDAVTVNGAAVANGVRWVGGNPPPSTANEDILTFSILRDSTGVTRVYCSSSINIS
jgi:hypothetical protein|tara:strand:- start:4164 stop:5186 length:1023 start_codon:yes stop_codon:yes gene_type:complete